MVPPSSPQLLAWRWLALAAGLWMQTVSGNTYSFGVWSGAFKERMGYSQQRLGTLATFKDVGDNIGVIAGTLYDYLPIWALFLVGAVQNVVGYGGLWLAASGRVVKPPFWVECALICIGTNGATFFQTSTVVTLVKNFPAHRGVVVGLAKGFTGLSGAIFTQVYYAAFFPHQTTFLLLVALSPPIVALLCVCFIRPIPPSLSDEEQEEEHSNFIIVYRLALSLAAFLLVTILARDLLHMSHRLDGPAAAVMLLLLGALGGIPLRQYWAHAAHLKEHPAVTAAGVLVEAAAGQKRSPAALEEGAEGKSLPGHHERHKHEENNNWLDVENRAESIAFGLRSEEDDWHRLRVQDSGTFWQRHEKRKFGRRKRLSTAAEQREREDRERAGEQACLIEEAATSSERSVQACSTSESDEEAARQGQQSARGCYQTPLIGADHGVLEAFATVEFWILFLSSLCGAGSGLTAINNLAQIGASQGAGESIGAFVSLISIWSFLGRVATGLISEHYVRKYGTPRPVFSLVTQAMMAAGHLLFASALPGSLYLGSLLVGTCYGAQWTLMPAITSELFGLARFGAILNWQQVAIPTGSYILSVLVAGYLYDREAHKEHKHLPPLLHTSSGERAWGASKAGALRRELLDNGDTSGQGGHRSGDGGSWLPHVRQSRSVKVSPEHQGCTGSHCFRLTFFVMAGVCVVGMLLNLWLALRTREYYRGIWKVHLETETRKNESRSATEEESLVGLEVH